MSEVVSKAADSAVTVATGVAKVNVLSISVTASSEVLRNVLNGPVLVVVAPVARTRQVI